VNVISLKDLDPNSKTPAREEIYQGDRCFCPDLGMACATASSTSASEAGGISWLLFEIIAVLPLALT